MRRKEREVTDLTRIREILEECEVCHLGLVEDGKAYVVPLNFGYTLEDGKLSLYFHSAASGRKVEILRKNPMAAFSIDRSYHLITGPRGCDYSMTYASIMGEGRVQLIETREEKRKMLFNLMKKFHGEHLPLEEKHIDAVLMLKLEVDSFTAKQYVTQ